MRFIRRTLANRARRCGWRSRRRAQTCRGRHQNQANRRYSEPARENRESRRDHRSSAETNEPLNVTSHGQSSGANKSAACAGTGFSGPPCIVRVFVGSPVGTSLLTSALSKISAIPLFCAASLNPRTSDRLGAGVKFRERASTGHGRRPVGKSSSGQDQGAGGLKKITTPDTHTCYVACHVAPPGFPSGRCTRYSPEQAIALQ